MIGRCKFFHKYAVSSVIFLNTVPVTENLKPKIVWICVMCAFLLKNIAKTARIKFPHLSTLYTQVRSVELMEYFVLIFGIEPVSTWFIGLLSWYQTSVPTSTKLNVRTFTSRAPVLCNICYFKNLKIEHPNL